MNLITLLPRGATCFGILTNTILIPLIQFCSPSDIGVYKYLMLYIALFEIFFGSLELVTVPDMYTKDSAFLVTVDPVKAVLPDSLLQLSLLIYCGSFSVSLAIFGVQFAYRYQVVKGNSSWTTSKLSNMVVWMGIPIIVSILWTLSCAFFLERNEYVDMVMSREQFPFYTANKTFGFVGIYFYPKLPGGTSVVNWDSFIGMALCTCILFGSEFLMIYFAVKTYLAIKRMMTSTHSSTFRKLQWQLFYALVSQTVIPIFFMQIPLSMIYLTLFLNISSPIFGSIQQITVTFYLATDALPTIFIIKPYREQLLARFRCVKATVSNVVTSSRVVPESAAPGMEIPSQYIAP